MIKNSFHIIAISIVVAFFGDPAAAQQITIEASTFASVRLGSTTYTDRQVTITGIGDVSNVQNNGNVHLLLTDLVTFVEIEGVEPVMFTDAIQAVVNNNSDLGGFGNTSIGNGLLFIFNSELATYDMTTTFGPVFGTPIPVFGVPHQTTDGAFRIDAVSASGSFTVTVNEGSAPPASYIVFRGIELSGDISDFADSDDVKAEYNPGFTLSTTEDPVWLIFEANAPTATSFFVESSAGTTGLRFRVEAWNWSTQSYEEIGTVSESFNNDTVHEFQISPANIDTNGAVRSRVGWKMNGLLLNFPWELDVDQIGWN